MTIDANQKMDPPRIGIIGARRRAQGIGQYLARDLSATGGDVCAVVGTTHGTVDEARRTLESEYALEVRGYVDAAKMIEDKSLDAVVICSPQQFHRDHLDAALRARQHVLCEKPLVFDFDRDNVSDAGRLIDGFAAADLVLMANQQWPYTLDAFQRCYPQQKRTDAVHRLEMMLAPARDGIVMIPDSIPHVASMLLAVAPVDGRAEQFRCSSAGTGDLRIAFQYRHTDGCVDVDICLAQVAAQPRPAAYAINGCTVCRRIQSDSYQMYFEPTDHPPVRLTSQDAQITAVATSYVPLEDPLRLLAADFIRRIQRPQISPHDDECLLQNVRLVQQVYEAVQHSQCFRVS